MNDETILALGEYCKQQLLGAEPFQALIELYGQQCAADMLGTKPDDRDGRERIHAAYTGFNDFLALAAKFADAYDRLLAETGSAVTTDHLEDDPGVHSIYE